MARQVRRKRRAKRGISSIIGTIFFILVVIIVLFLMTTMFNSFFSFTQNWNQINAQNIQRQETSLSVSNLQFGSSIIPSGSSNPPTFNVNSIGTSTTGTATSYTFDRKLVYAQNLWWAFYSDGTNIVYETSTDGITWTPKATLTTLAGSTLGYNFNIWLSGSSTLYFVLTQYRVTTSFIVGFTTLGSNGAASPLTTLTQATASGNNVGSYASVTTDSSGNVWVSVSTVQTRPPRNGFVEVYECPQALGSACTNMNAGIGFGNGDDVVNMIFGLSVGNIALLYADSGGNFQAFALKPVDITTCSASCTPTSWSTVVATTSSYDFHFSSAIAISSTIYFAGTTSTQLLSWSFTYGSVVAPTENVVNGSSGGWQASISQDGIGSTVSITYGQGSNVYFTTSSNGGATWSARQTVSNSENNVQGMAATFGGTQDGAIWTSGSSSPFTIRFAVVNTQAFNPTLWSPSTVQTSTTNDATSTTSQNKLIYAQGLWWDFFSDGTTGINYATSSDGIVWSAETLVTAASGSLHGSDFSLWISGTVVYWALATQNSASSFTWGFGVLQPGGTVTWTTATITTTATTQGPISIETDTSGNTWVAVTTLTTPSTYHIEVYEHTAGAGAGTWSGNLAPSALSSLTANANSITLSPGTAGAVLIYQTGASSGSGVISIITTTTGSAWSSPVSPPSDYVLPSSSAALVGSTISFAGLATSTTGATTGTLNSWTFTVGSASTSAETTIESATSAWQAALGSYGGTLTLFDASVSTISYYVSNTFGSSWSQKTTVTTYEPSVTGLSAALAGTIAVTWTNGNISPYNVRFGSLSSIQVSDNSAFAIHAISIYVYNPGTASLVAHFDTNSSASGVSGTFDYWIGAGTTLAVPISFNWAVSTSYLVTVTTDAGVQTSQTFTSPA